jgi:hypothetical protein
VYHEIEEGAEFYLDENEYLDNMHKECKGEKEITYEPAIHEQVHEQQDEFSRKRKRPKRTTANKVHSYAVPDSEDEMIQDRKPPVTLQPAETNLQKWIRHLTLLAKEEQRKASGSYLKTSIQ